jgi:hypothetical protein
MYSTNAVPHYIQGPENFPAESSRFYAANLAKNGAAIVTCRIIQNRIRENLRGDSAHMLIYDLDDYGVQNYLDQLVEGIHCYGAKATGSPLRLLEAITIKQRMQNVWRGKGLQNSPLHRSNL